MKTIEIEANMDMEAVGALAELKTEMAGSHFPPPVTVAVALSKSEESYLYNTSPELVMMEPHSNVCNYRPNFGWGDYNVSNQVGFCEKSGIRTR